MTELRLEIIGGRDKSGKEEPVKRLEIRCGEIIGIVGPTGAGKSTLINDIEQLASGDTFSRRNILVNGKKADLSIRTDPKKKIIAQLSQSMHFLTDMTVWDFLVMHIKSRGKSPDITKSVIDLANTLAGEKILPNHQLTILSGGQTRSLMIADIALVSQSPVVLIDEIENAGIKKQDALKILTEQGKIVMVVTHDPMLSLMTNRRVVMSNGGIQNILSTTDSERKILRKIVKMDNYLLGLRERIRQGECIE